MAPPATIAQTQDSVLVASSPALAGSGDDMADMARMEATVVELVSSHQKRQVLRSCLRPAAASANTTSSASTAPSRVRHMQKSAKRDCARILDMEAAFATPSERV